MSHCNDLGDVNDMSTLSHNDALISSSEVVSRSGMGDAIESVGTAEDVSRWRDAIDSLLIWRKEACSSIILDTAIDLAVDLAESNVASPSSIMASDDGDVAFEWRESQRIELITVFGEGLAEFTVFKNGRVVEEGEMRRNPRTRELEVAFSEE